MMLLDYLLIHCNVCTKSIRKQYDVKAVKEKNKPWWDEELEMLRKHKHRRLRLLHLEHSELAVSQYRNIRNQFKKLFRQKKMLYKLKIREKIEGCKSAADFWNEIHLLRNPNLCINNISSSMWYEYFSTLLNMTNEMDESHAEYVNNYVTIHNSSCDECNRANVNMSMNSKITISEVDAVISLLDSGKASGLDGITYECLKKSKVIIVPLLCQLFNKILDMGIFPDAWCKALVVPIHKSGSSDDPSNYRGISLLSCVSKVFSKILNNRLVTWAEENNKLFDEQGGYTKGKGTIYQIFILQSLVSKYLCRKGGRCYNIFINFSKAFYTIPHSHMFYRLIREGVHGQIIKLLQNMYSKLKSCIQPNRSSITDTYNCTIGRRQ